MQPSVSSSDPEFLPTLEPAPDVLGGAALMIPVLSPTRHEWYERGVGARRALVVSTVLECAEIRLLDLELFGLLAYARDQFWIAEEVCACARAHVFSHTKPCMTSHIHTHTHATSHTLNHNHSHRPLGPRDGQPRRHPSSDVSNASCTAVPTPLHRDGNHCIQPPSPKPTRAP